MSKQLTYGNGEERTRSTSTSSTPDCGRAGIGEFKCVRSGKRRKRTNDLNLIKLARQRLESKVEVRDGDRRRRLSKREIGVMKLVNRFAESGDPKIFMILVDLLHKGDGPEVIELPAPRDVRRWTDDEIFDAFIYFWDSIQENPSTNDEVGKDAYGLGDSNDPAFWSN